MSALTDQQIAEFEEKFDKDKYQAELAADKKKEPIKDNLKTSSPQTAPKASSDSKKTTRPPQKSTKYRGQCAEKNR